ncbi:MAG: tRNA/rRNA methyltransferase [Candidatus Yanofskybacteria bacterium GW2011_GWA1_39_13]|uniref:tRNA/rRNA methyltransferase n=1 Tax=Yanofskybacteria sp. (strain GW2011_GWA1_39_13) TaxID=1619019 RepID=A0A0G0MPP4_YANXG|nr:MAG: tRNA/rRNA methyltransferase [Candidatus Yanofskybacteria bacterium GW2011_GWA1_39_13]
MILVLCNVRSRENVGSIFRTADAVGVSKIYLCGITPTPPHEKISKTALGAETYVQWEYRKQAWRLLLELKNKKSKCKIVGLEQTRDSQNIFTFKPKFPLALVVGNEVNGLSPQILKYCDKKVFIPMYGKKESLNVSVATGIALFQLR